MESSVLSNGHSQRVVRQGVLHQTMNYCSPAAAPGSPSPLRGVLLAPARGRARLRAVESTRPTVVRAACGASRLDDAPVRMKSRALGESFERKPRSPAKYCLGSRGQLISALAGAPGRIRSPSSRGRSETAGGRPGWRLSLRCRRAAIRQPHCSGRTRPHRTDFIERRLEWFADAMEGKLRYPRYMPERDPQGSYRI